MDVRGRPPVKCEDRVKILEGEEGQENERYGECRSVMYGMQKNEL